MEFQSHVCDWSMEGKYLNGQKETDTGWKMLEYQQDAKHCSKLYYIIIIIYKDQFSEEAVTL